eukprot:14688087-Ditylum_brightwellii.AAC.1
MTTMWQKIRFTDRKRINGSLTSLQIPSSWLETTEDVSSVKEVENPKTAMENRLHFGQAEGTPFTIPPIKHEVDWAANSITSELILNGEYSNEELDDLAKKLLNHCKRKKKNLNIGESITEKEWRNKIKACTERTTTSPSGQHLGHLKALQSRRPDDPSSEEGKLLATRQKRLVNTQVEM